MHQGWLHSLIKLYLPSSRVDVRLRPEDDRIEARVTYSEMDLERWRSGFEADARDAAQTVRDDLVPRRRAKRRLHWGKRH